MGAKKGGKPDLSRQWFVFYSYRNPATGKMERQPPIYKDINTFDTIGERKQYGNAVITIYNELLKAGFSPYEYFVNPGDGMLNKNIISCAEFYLSEKKKSLSIKGFRPYNQNVRHFMDWVKKNRLEFMEIDKFKRAHIMQFLSDYRDQSAKAAQVIDDPSKRKPAGNRQINNIKDNISGFFNYFKTNFEDEVPRNPVAGIKDLPAITQGNKAYTERQIALLKEIMQADNPNMLMFCEFVYETCTRPHEEARLIKVGDLEFDQNRIHIRPELSKEGRSEWIPMSGRYMNTLKEYVKDAPDNLYLFTINRHPGKAGAQTPFTVGREPVSEWRLQEWYRDIKAKAGLDATWSIYSWTHTYCVRAYLDTKDVYFIQMKKRHTDLSVTCKYLRNLGLFVDLNMIADNVRGL